MSYKEAYEENHIDFEISSIVYEDDKEGDRPDPITFEYSAPNIGVDSSGRFVEHDIVGGDTVRQKIGEDPVEIDISGVCKEPTARQLDGLRDAKYGDIFSNRLTGGSYTVHFASVSTDPMDDGGAVAMTDSRGEFLYNFNLSTVEIDVGEYGDILRPTTGRIAGANFVR